MIDAGTRRWLAEVRRFASEYARADIGDHCLGQLLAKAPEGENGIWPCEAVCDAMEEIGSPRSARGFYIGVRNARGAHWRGEGGEQRGESPRNTARWPSVHFDYPYVGGVLEGIAASYERQAEREDFEAKIRKRLPN